MDNMIMYEPKENEKLKYNLTNARRKSGKTQQMIAEELEISRVMYNRYERGQTEIPPDMAFRLAKIFNITVEEIYERKERK